MLTCERVLNEFTNSCFGHFLNFDTITQLSSVVVYNILANEINVEDFGAFGIWFGIGQRKVKFSKMEFCLITRLKFEEPSSPITRVYTFIKGGIFMTY